MTSKPDDGGLAFPNLIKETPHGNGIVAIEGIATGGMTLRQWYAGLAMQGLLAQAPKSDHASEFARQAVIMADTLIEELKK